MEVLSGIELRAKINDKKGLSEKGELIFKESQSLLTDIFAQRLLDDIFRAALLVPGRSDHSRREEGGGVEPQQPSSSARGWDEEASWPRRDRDDDRHWRERRGW